MHNVFCFVKLYIVAKFVRYVIICVPVPVTSSAMYMVGAVIQFNSDTFNRYWNRVEGWDFSYKFDNCKSGC